MSFKSLSKDLLVIKLSFDQKISRSIFLISVVDNSNSNNNIIDNNGSGSSSNND